MAYYSRASSSAFPSASTAGALEQCTKWTYDVQQEAWSHELVHVHFFPDLLGEGGMRLCYRMDEVFPDGSTSPYVAKFFRPEMRAREEDVFNEAVVQYVADTFAQDFNRKPTPRKVAFLPCYVLQRTTRSGQPLCFAEPFLKGRFDKHNNNFGGNFTRDPIPAAFSHFSFESSNHLLLVCDIQGVGDFYTDPQIHSFDGRGFGFGNMGSRGIDRFLATHRCNDVCRVLGLPAIQPVTVQGMALPGFPPGGFMAPANFPQMGGFGGANRDPLASMMRMLQQMPLAQGGHPALGAPQQVMPNALLQWQQQQQQQEQLQQQHRRQLEREERDLQLALTQSLHDAQERDIQQAVSESLREAEESQLRALSESSVPTHTPGQGEPVVRAYSVPEIQSIQHRGLRTGLRQLLHHPAQSRR
eukprot:GGOE01058406.1.p1 GENE.GGOE01058406.1~~GGOE01058406.1.p1  ORF type:complete len:440 (+),score=112.98 GGOE01058406.1:80-1321(+)